MKFLDLLPAIILSIGIIVIIVIIWFEAEWSSDFGRLVVALVVGSLLGLIIGLLVKYLIGYVPRDKRSAKRFNESVKLAANAVSAMALTVIGAAVIVPLIRPEDAVTSSPADRILWIVGALIAQIFAHAILGLIKSEDV